MNNDFNTKNPIIPRTKIWLECNGEVVFGSGRMALFKAINETKSIRQAAKKLGMSYRAAWGKIKATEERLGVKLTVKDPSGTALTKEAFELLDSYEKFQKYLRLEAEKLFDIYLKKFNK